MIDRGCEEVVAGAEEEYGWGKKYQMNIVRAPSVSHLRFCTVLYTISIDRKQKSVYISIPYTSFNAGNNLI